MLGEAALTRADAEYTAAIAPPLQRFHVLSKDRRTTSSNAPVFQVSFPALHPRYEWTSRERVLRDDSILTALGSLGAGVRHRHDDDAEEADRPRSDA